MIQQGCTVSQEWIEIQLYAQQWAHAHSVGTCLGSSSGAQQWIHAQKAKKRFSRSSDAQQWGHAQSVGTCLDPSKAMQLWTINKERFQLQQ